MPHDDDAGKRYAGEAEYHDKKYTSAIGEPAHYALNPTYDIFLRMLEDLREVRGKTVLECGCGTGWITAELAALGATVHAFDISSESVKATREFVAQRGLDRCCVVENKVAEEMDYPDESFDWVVGFAILHHLDLDKAIPQIYRVLKPSGKAIFAEPLAGNPLLGLYRKLTPQYRTPDEEPLQVERFLARLPQFSNLSHQEFYLTALLPLFMANCSFLNITKRMLRPFLSLDRMLFKLVPCSRRWAWYTIVTFEK